MTIDPINPAIQTHPFPLIIGTPFNEPEPPIVWQPDTFQRVGKAFDCEN